VEYSFLNPQMCLPRSRWAIKENPLLGREAELGQPGSLPDELNDIAVTDTHRFGSPRLGVNQLFDATTARLL
jgi:hypothetical protein